MVDHENAPGRERTTRITTQGPSDVVLMVRSRRVAPPVRRPAIIRPVLILARDYTAFEDMRFEKADAPSLSLSLSLYLSLPLALPLSRALALSLCVRPFSGTGTQDSV